MRTNILIHPQFHLPSKGELLNKPTQMQMVIAVVSQQPMERAKKQWPDRSSQKKDRHRAVSEAVGLGTAEILGSVS